MDKRTNLDTNKTSKENLGKNLALTLLALIAFCAFATAQETANDWFVKGQEFFDNGSFKEAARAFDEATGLDNGNASLWLSKAQMLDFAGERGKAQDAYHDALNLTDQCLEENSNDADSWWTRGVILDALDKQTEATESRERAIQIYNQTLAKNPDDGEAWFKRAEVLVSLFRREEAISSYEKVVELNSSKKGPAEASIALLLQEMGRYNDSIEAADRALELTPKGDNKELIIIWSIRSQALTESNRLEEALWSYENVTRINPEDKYSRMGMAWTFDKLGRYNQSIEAYEKVLELDPMAINAWIGKGDALNATGRNDLALAAYNQALEIDEQELQANPENADAWYRKGMVLFKMGEYEKALAAYNRSIEVSAAPPATYTSNEQAWAGIGDTLHALGRNQDALEGYKKAIDLYPLDPDAWHGKGEVLVALGKRIEGDMAFTMADKLGYRENESR